jgi:hypothetical protein
VAEIFPRDYPGLVDIRSPEMIATALLHFLAKDFSKMLRHLFIQNFTLERYLTELAALLSEGQSASTSKPVCNPTFLNESSKP